MKTVRAKIAFLLLALPLACAFANGQDQSFEQGMVEAGTRWSWGQVYGRPDLPFDPALKTSKYYEYRDLRDGFFVRRFRLSKDDIAGSKYYLDLQSDRAIYHDQSYLGTFGQWNRFKVQFRYDEIPHIYSNTTRTLYTQTAPGVLTIPLLIRNQLQTLAASSATSLPSTIQTQLVPSMSFITPQIERRAGTALFSYDFNPNLDITASYSREHETGNRPFGLIINSSPSASLTGGYGVEVPEPINYFIDAGKFMIEYTREKWGIQVGYSTSYFQNSIGSLTFDNPFRTTDCVAPTNCTTATQGPATGRVDLYPDNHANYFNFAGTFVLPLRLRLIASINLGWLHQNDPFLPYSTNSIQLALDGPLPASSLNAKKRTLAMNYKLIESLTKKFQIKAGYRQYDYDNQTHSLSFTPIQGDISAPDLTNPEENSPFGYNKKNIEVTGNWFFARKSSIKAGYEGEIMDRSHRDTEHSRENGLVAAIDSDIRKDLSFRASYRYSVRDPEEYVDEESLVISGGITADNVFNRRFDEAARLRHRGDVELTYSPTDRLSVSGFGGTVQDDYNRRGGTNSATPLNFTTTTADPYYLYGLLKDLNYNAGFDGDFMLTSSVSVFAEYSWERYDKSMSARYRVPGGATPTPLDCSISGRGCDSANNDWGSRAREFVHITTAGFDLHPGKKAYINAYYSLSAAKGHVTSRPFSDPTLITGPDKFLLTGTNAAVDYPDTVSRMHEAVVIFKYKLTSKLMPKVEYRYQQFDSHDYQTSAMTPYMGCVSPLPPGAAVPGCPNVMLGTPSQFYPFFVVGDTSAARYLFLGTDQPSYKAHYLATTLEYHF